MSALVWWQGADPDGFDRANIVTRNADGGETGWTIEDAKKLHHALGEILAWYDGKRMPIVKQNELKGQTK